MTAIQTKSSRAVRRVVALAAITAAAAVGVGFSAGKDSTEKSARVESASKRTPLPAFGQPGHVHYPPGSILGSETPQLIPTSTAISLMLSTIADASARDEAQGTSLAQTYLRSIASRSGGLSQSDRAVLLAAAKAHRSRMQLAADDASMRAAFGTVNARLAEQSWKGLLSQLSPPAISKLEQHVETRVKPSINILP